MEETDAGRPRGKVDKRTHDETDAADAAYDAYDAAYAARKPLIDASFDLLDRLLAVKE